MSEEAWKIRRPKAVAIVSGGMDSVTLAYYLARTTNWHSSSQADLLLLSFDYGQRHVRELECAKLAAQRLGAEHRVIDLRQVGVHLKGSALTDAAVPVPDGHYAAESMKATVVPNRNSIMLAIAFGVAVAECAEAVAIGVHAGDHWIYPDCRPEFLSAFEEAEKLANVGFGSPMLHLLAPFEHGSKADIVIWGAKLGVPFEDTWSCYKGGANHCGTCGTCTERREAFQVAGVVDPTFYEVSRVPHQ